VQRLRAECAGAHHRLEDLLAAMDAQQKLEAGEFAALSHSFRGSLSTLESLLSTAGALELPVLRNMVEGQSLRDFLAPRTLPRASGLGAQSIDGVWVHRLLDSYAEVGDKLTRVSKKSLGSILAQQKRIAARFRDSFAHVPE
jgi:hypothetical protein